MIFLVFINLKWLGMNQKKKKSHLLMYFEDTVDVEDKGLPRHKLKVPRASSAGLGRKGIGS